MCDGLPGCPCPNCVAGLPPIAYNAAGFGQFQISGSMPLFTVEGKLLEELRKIGKLEEFGLEMQALIHKYEEIAR